LADIRPVNSGSPQPTEPGIRAALGRILGSRSFANAPMLRRLLEYLVEHSLVGNDRELKEYTVGVDVFDRGTAFDPRIDTIVRAQVRRLRAKLDHYYRLEGAGDPLLLHVPKGRYLVECRAAPGARDAPVNETRALATGAPAIVVLPFVNLSGDTTNDYFVDGLTDEITSALASVQALRVVSRTSAFQFRQRSDDIRNIGAELGVQSALEGSVRKDGQRVRVTAQLVDVTSGFQLWSHTFDGELPGVFGLQEKTARAIVQALRIRLTPGEREKLRPAEPASIEAYDLYLRGLACFYKASPEKLQASVEYMEAAIAIDPTYAPAYATMADAYALWATVGDRPAPRLIEQARAAAQRALELDDLAEAHAAMATVLTLEWRLDEADAAFSRSIALKPSYVYPRLTYAVFLCAQHRVDEAINQTRVALTLDPLSPLSRTILGQSLVLAGRASEAIDELHRAIALSPDFVFAYYTLAIAHIVRRSYADAIAALEPIRDLAEHIPNCAGHMGFAYASLGNRAEARRLLQLLLDLYPGDWAPWIDIAAIYAGLGDSARALEWLERGYQHRCFDALFLREDPRFDILRADARFNQLAERTLALPPVGASRP
jgi:TolB-like protein/Tfp pilus assembly protein PilF